MDHTIALRFQQLSKNLEEDFGPDLDTQGILFLIGVQELGKGYQAFKKHEKTDLMHIALCTVLEPYGYYKYQGNDEDGWPHFEFLKELPHLEEREQQHFIKEAILEYFEVNEIVKTEVKDN
jgi:hypothetical protein